MAAASGGIGASAHRPRASLLPQIFPERTMSKPNALSRALERADVLPAVARRRLVTLIFGRRVRFAGTGGVEFEELGIERAILHLKNRRKVQNHIAGIHAAAMALLAESATGAVFGMNVPDSHLPLLKCMHVDYVRRAEGALRAEASLSAAQRARIATEAKGDIVVPVRVTDSAGEEPIKCEMCWAWVPKKRG
jgi:acyl-coenzyme A thioesterase PaaI-like protein